jgi:hypothetical protein
VEEPPSLLGKKVVIGGYGSLDLAYTRMFGKDGAVVGLEGALLLNHRLSIGVAGYAWTNPQPGPADIDGTRREFDMAYIGGTLRYSLITNFPAYVTLGVLVGGGGVFLTPRDHDRDDSPDHQSGDAFMVVQPDITAHVNLIPWLRIGATVGYRFTSGVGRFGFTESDVNGVVIGGHVQIGRF